MDDIGFLPATDLTRLYATRTLSPREAIDVILARIDRLEPQLNAIAHLRAEPARREAQAAEAAILRGDPVGVLHGVPVTIKDMFWTHDQPCEAGSHIQQGFRPPDDTPLVARLRAAGAIVLGKTTCSEFGWSGVSHAPLTGITHNPWRHGLNAGASSAGAGVAAAAGYGPLHQGSDGAGSVRMPAAFCGVYGLKPSFGRVPYAPVPTGDSTSHVGPLTRTVADAALMLHVMAGPHHRDHTTLESPPADYPARLRERPARMRIAFSPDLGHARVDPEVAALVRTAAERFAASLGVDLAELTPAWGPDGPALARVFWPAHFTRFAPALPEWEGRMDPGFVACIRAGLATSMTDYMLARARKAAYVAAIHAFFEDWDFLVTPAVPVAAFPAELLQPPHWPQHPWDWLSWSEFSYPFNMSWNPAASLPCGFTADGLPVGLQIVGRRFDDLGVLQMSALFEQALPWADRRPPLD